MRKIIVMGSVGAAVILVLAMFTTVVSAQAIQSDELKTNIFQYIEDKIASNTWEPGFFLFVFFMIIVAISEILKYGIPI